MARLTGELVADMRDAHRRFLPEKLNNRMARLINPIEAMHEDFVTLYWRERNLGKIGGAIEVKGLKRKARMLMYKRLGVDCPSLNKEQRADLIRTATELVELKPQETLDAVLKALSRAKRKSVRQAPR